jgi:hypothetical protein
VPVNLRIRNQAHDCQLSRRGGSTLNCSYTSSFQGARHSRLKSFCAAGLPVRGGALGPEKLV